MNIFNFLRGNEIGNLSWGRIIQDDIGEPPWDYYFLQDLDEKQYPLYLAKLFKINTGEKLPLRFDFKQQAWVIDKKKCKTFNQKIQWLKLYGVTDLMRMCTDKVAVRDYVAGKIGSEYLKPVLQIIGENPLPNPPQGEGVVPKPSMGVPSPGRGLGRGLNNDVSTYFDQIDWDKLPNSFVIKCNHGCNWQYIVKNKEDVLSTKPIVNLMKKNITGWLEQEYCFWQGFEMQYKTFSPHPNPPHPGREDNYSYSIVPKILIEPLMRDDINIDSEEIQFYCFDGSPRFIVRLHDANNGIMSLYDENLNIIDKTLSKNDIKVNKPIDENVKSAFDLSKILSKNFKFVRVDWMLYNNKIYFSELTFTPNSGFHRYYNNEINLMLGNLMELGE